MESQAAIVSGMHSAAVCVPVRSSNLQEAELVRRCQNTSDKIKELIKDKDVALTTDGWTSLVTVSYVTATAHWINDDWEMLNNVLKTKELKVSHTAENVGKCF